MIVKTVSKSQAAGGGGIITDHIVRVEHTILLSNEEEYTIIVLDAEDSLDIAVQYPNNEREIVWSLIKESDGT